MSKFTLSTYLMLSVVFIISGIAWVILSQTDDRFDDTRVYGHSDSDQDELLRQFSKLQEKYLTLPEAQQATPIIESQPVVKPVASDSLQISTAQAPDNVWSDSLSTEIEPIEFMRNNPWSPDYQPGY